MQSDLINADEFEEIAEIYDSIRVLHSQINPSKDVSLAEDFDLNLREIMESLSSYVNDSTIKNTLKKEKSLKSKFMLYAICADKITDFLKEFEVKNLRQSTDTRFSGTGYARVVK